MDIKILDSWLREHLKTDANQNDIAKCLTLCGPSIEKVELIKLNSKNDYIYHIEITTNRVDLMSVRGIAREASVILPEFGFKSELIELEKDNNNHLNNPTATISIKTNPKLVNRLMGVILEINEVNKSPLYIKQRLESSGMRSLNAIVDITNYIMTEIGQPTHVFDYDLIKPFLGVRESKKGEIVTSFDGKSYSLPGGDIVFENDKGTIIDLPGIIGTKNSVVNENTKRILFFIDSNDPVKLRKTSMTLGIRTVAVTLNEKFVDPELGEEALNRGLLLFKKICNAKQISKIYDIYSNKPIIKPVKINHAFIERIIGISISTERVIRILTKLGIQTNYNGNNHEYVCIPPSFRAKDINIPEDIVEEIARIYGYHNISSKIMTGEINISDYDSPFEFEDKLRTLLSGFGGTEIYTLSLIPKTLVEASPLKLKNPLGSDTEYLRTSLRNSLIQAINENVGIKDKIHFFELANVYIPKINILPDEKMTLAGIFKGYAYREAKGVIESLFNKLNINIIFEKYDLNGFDNSKAVKIYSGSTQLGVLGYLSKQELIYYEYDIEILRKFFKDFPKYNPIPKFPSQIEDLTLVLKENTLIGRVIEEIKLSNKFIANCELIDIFDQSYTFRIWYQNPEKTLDNSETEKIRKVVLKNLENKFSAKTK
jgi:phenylalanyl-tRNA synthetase beta chain